MKKFKFITLFLLLLVFMISLLSPYAFAAESIDIQAKAAVLVEVSSGNVLYTKEADTKLPPASITKVMTVLLAVEACEEGKVTLDDMVTASADAMSDLDEDGSTQGIQAGETMSLRDLMYCALVSSANEACNIIGEYLAGSKEAFVEQMNQRAQELGCSNTHFANTHGLPNDNHYTTAWDLYLIFSEAIHHELFMEIAGTYEYQTEVTNRTPERRELTNTNKLIDPTSDYYYEYCTGGKTGSTDAAGYCLASVADNDGVKLISIVLGAQQVEKDGYIETMSFVETRRLFQWGYSNFSYHTLLSTTDLVKEIDVAMGDGVDSVVLRPEKDVVVYMDNAIDVADFERTYRIYSEESGETLKAPIEEGEVLGEMTISYGGQEFGTVKLVANTRVDLNHLAYLRTQIAKFFSSPIVILILVIVVLLLATYVVLVVRYNQRRKKQNAVKRRAQAAEKAKEQNRLTTGKSFEEIYNESKK
jgi:D-alanyl-D-alanine carboxypeptidase (penicillin-binding protein 5/6)